MRFRCYLIAAILISAVSLSACKTVSENSSGLPDTAPPTAPLTEISSSEDTAAASDSLSETTAGTPDNSETASAAAENTEQETTTAENTETAGTSAAVTVVVVPKTETLPQKTETYTETSESSRSETEKTPETSLTLQHESPPEPDISQTAQTQNNNGSRNYSTVNFREQKGFWITYLEYMSVLKNKSESSFKASVENYFDNISALGFNTVYVQVRAFGDAYYDSLLFPSGEQYNGTIGAGSSFDALKIMVKAAHERGLSVHAWVNPMRLMTSSQIENISDRYIIKNWYNNYNGTYIAKSGERWYLNPAYDEVTDLIADGISEIVRNYDVDGIQIDDYFYPTTAESFDKAAYSASGTSLSLAEWRMSNVNKMVKKLYKAAHNANPNIVFGISPQGSIENDYDETYADVRTWCSQSGYCDYILPQVYFGFDNAALPYAEVISQWSGMVKNADIKLVIGLAAYKIGAADNYAGAKGKNEWTENSDIISRQMELAKALSNYGGVALYRYESVFAPSSDVAEQVSKEIENIKK